MFYICVLILVAHVLIDESWAPKSKVNWTDECPAFGERDGTSLRAEARRSVRRHG